MNRRYRFNEPDATAESFDSEVLAINLKTGDYHSLRGAGVQIWRLLVEGICAAEICAWLAAPWRMEPAALAPEVELLVRQLVERELLVAVETGATPPAAPPAWVATLTAPYAPVLMESYSDMKDLLLIDPIHEVDVTGWPNTPPPPSQA